MTKPSHSARGSARAMLRRRRLAALLAGAMVPLVLLAGMLLPTRFEETEAGWTATTQAQAEAEAAVIPMPTLTAECDYLPGVLGLGAKVEIYWAPPPGYELENMTLLRSSEGGLTILEPILGFSFASNTSGPEGGPYTTTIPTGLLGGLLNAGDVLRVGISANDSESGWQSEPVVVEARILPLGIGECTNITA